MSVAQPDFAQPGELEVELWDGEEVVKGQPTPRHDHLDGCRYRAVVVEGRRCCGAPHRAP